VSSQALATLPPVCVPPREGLPSELLASVADWPALFDQAPLAAVTVDDDGRVWSANRAAAALAGRPAPEFVGLSLGDAFRCTRRAESPCGAGLACAVCGLRGAVADTFQSGLPLHRVDATLHIHGQSPGVERHLLVSTVLPAAAARPLILLWIEDVTVARALEAQVQRLQRLETVGRLSGAIAHDFNNLLTVLGGYADLILDGLPASHTLRADVEQIRQATDRATALTRRLLTFTRGGSTDSAVLDLSTVLTDLQNLLHRLLGESIELRFHLGPDLGRVRADLCQIEHVILNLVANARDAMPDGGSLLIQTADAAFDQADSRRPAGVPPGSYILLTVTDTGVGMPREVQERLFDPFFSTKPPDKGTGLGLWTVRNVVHEAGGTIEVDSQPGLGTTIRIYLPMVAEPAPQAELPIAPEVPPPGSGTVLLVESDAAVRAVAAAALLRQGYCVLEARHPAEALLIAERRRDPIHLLVTNACLPHLSGQELACRVARLHPGVAVLFLTNVLSGESVSDAPGARRDVLPKPFTPASLARKAHELILPSDRPPLP